MNLKQALAHARETLRNNNIEDAPLEGEILLRHVLGISRARFFSQFDEELSPGQGQDLKEALERRVGGEPTAYITGHREFYGLDFIVNRDVLIPRPETELLVEKAIALAGRRPIKKIADIGTGSGAIAISLAVNLPRVTIYATDISSRALGVARRNCKKHGVEDRIVLLQGNLLEPLQKKVDLIVANLPYVRATDVKGTLSFEPLRALNGGEDGLDNIRLFCRQAAKKLAKQGCLLLEVGQGQSRSVGALLEKELPGAVSEIYRDLAGIERVVSLSLT
ncbi:MAG: peptide chain release factor N(5)-glutamine methyltransferase [Dehalococcoidales bacterium]